MNEPIYLDYNASTPVAPQVLEAMSVAASAFGNPSSGHWAGSQAREIISRARQQVATLLGCPADGIVFTSGGTEANNYAIKGAYFACGRRAAHIVTTAIEHPAVLNPCRFLQRLGARVSFVPVGRSGWVNPDDIQRALTNDTILITVMHANNETGVIQPVADIAAIARERDILFHTDAAQTPGKIPVDTESLRADMVSLAGHKFYAPKGIGALYLRDGLFIEPLLHGAGHENGRRAGTENVILAAALGAAAELARQALTGPAQEMARLRDLLQSRLLDTFGDRVTVNGDTTRRLPNTLHISFIGQLGSDILDRLPALAASTGSACHAGSLSISPVLRAMDIPREAALGAIRLSLGRGTTEAEVERAVEMFRASIIPDATPQA